MSSPSSGNLQKDIQSQGYYIEQSSDENGHHLKLSVPVEGVGNVLVHATVDKSEGPEKVEQLKTTLVQSVQKTVSQSKQIETDINHGQFASKLGHEVQQTKQNSSLTAALDALHIAKIEVKKDLVLTQVQLDEILRAVQSSDVDLAQAILTPEKVAAYEKQTQKSLAVRAIETDNPEMLKCVLDKKANVNAPDSSPRGNSYPIHHASYSNNFEFLQLLIEKGADPNLRDTLGNTALHLYVKHNDPKIIKLLLDAGADPDLINSNHHTAYFIAVDRHAASVENVLLERRNGKLPLIDQQRMLTLRFGLEFLRITAHGKRRVLRGSVELAYSELCRSLRSWRADPSSHIACPVKPTGESDWTKDDMEEVLSVLERVHTNQPLTAEDFTEGHMAAVPSGWTGDPNGHSTGAITSGNLFIQCNRGERPYGYSGMLITEMDEMDPQARLECMEKLAKSGEMDTIGTAYFNDPKLATDLKLRYPGIYSLHKDQGAPNCTWASAKLVFRALVYAKLRNKGYDHYSADIWSRAIYKNWSMHDRNMAVQDFLTDPEFNEDPQKLVQNGIDKKGVLQGVMEKSVNSRLRPAFQALMEANEVNVDTSNRYGLTPLHIACMKGDLVVVQDLLGKGFNVNKPDINGVTPFHIACRMGNPSIIQAMRPGANLNLQDKAGLAPVHIACMNGNFELFNYLKTEGADINAVDKAQKNILHYACLNPNPLIVQDIVTAGIAVNSQDANGVTPLHLASLKGDYQLSQFLMQCGANVNNKDTFGNDPLSLAASTWNFPELLDLYISGGANPSDGLLGAYNANNPFMVNHLLEKGADPAVFAEAGIEIKQNPFFQDMPALRLVS